MEIKPTDNIVVRKGRVEDLKEAYNLIMELAVYEKAPHEVENTPELMKEDAFGNNPIFGFLVAELNGKILGLAVYYFRYSTWKGKMLYLEDLIVTSEFRKMGIGRKLFDATLKEASLNRCRGMIWQVIEWNEPAFEFYKIYKPIIDPQWVTCRLTREQIENYKPVS